MESVRLSQQLQEFFHTEKIVVDAGLESVTRLLQIVAEFFCGLAVPSHWRLLDIERGERAWHFRWRSHAEQASCPHCHVVSRHLAHRYTPHTVQDLPLNGMTVYHTVIKPRYVCDQTECPVYTFVDPLAGFACPRARLSTRLKTLLIRLSLPSVIHRMPAALQSFGIVVSGDTLLRLVKAQGAIVIADNLTRCDVRVLDVDDANLRKGDPASGHSVFIDGETHRFLLVVQGTTQAIAEKVMAQWPTVEIVSRDRGSAYAAAAAAHDKTQVADQFHLVANLHEAIKDTLALTFGSDVFLPQGDGWEQSAEASTPATTERLPRWTLSPADRERRIRLARLTSRQAHKYRTTLALLEFADSDLRSATVAKRLGITRATLRRYRKEAPATLAQVETKLDAWMEAEAIPTAAAPIKTLASGARPAAESIVAPYHDTVVRLAAQGQGHRTIHAAIVSEGFHGSPNAIYQYLLKLRHEQAQAEEVPSEEEPKERPPRIGVQRIASSTIYRRILHEVAQDRAPILQARPGLAEAESAKAPEIVAGVDAPIPPSLYDDLVAALVFDTRTREVKRRPGMSPEVYAEVKNTFPVVAGLRQCLGRFMTVLDTSDETGLDAFIETYQQDPAEPIAQFASGLAKDLEAVKNCLRYPAISNGPMEGTNNKIKMTRRRGYGRTGVELLNALMALPWYYRDLDRAPGLPSEVA